MSLPIATESDEMRTFCAYLAARHLHYCHVPNENQVHRRFGVQKGFPDILIFNQVIRDPYVRGVAVEMKRIKNSRITPDQEAWNLWLRACGWKAEFTYGAVQAIKLVEELWPLRDS